MGPVKGSGASKERPIKGAVRWGGGGEGDRKEVPVKRVQ